jgi:hypothetical protein
MDHQYMIIAVAVLAVIGLIALWLQARRATKQAAKRLRRATGATGDIIRTIGIAAAILGFEWLIITFVTEWQVLVVVLGLPALLASRTVARLYAITAFARGDDR